MRFITARPTDVYLSIAYSNFKLYSPRITYFSAEKNTDKAQAQFIIQLHQFVYVVVSAVRIRRRTHTKMCQINSLRSFCVLFSRFALSLLLDTVPKVLFILVFGFYPLTRFKLAPRIPCWCMNLIVCILSTSITTCRKRV